MDGNEFKSRFLPYTNLIYKISFAITKDREDAEDVVQEVYEKLWKSRQSLSEVENDESFIVIMARNMALDRYRYKAKRQTSPLNNIVEVNHQTHSSPTRC
jgi:RNA polymerase sigma factor (sigma-70 family)